MRLRMLALVAALGPVAVGSAPALAGLAGTYVDTVSYFDVSDPPPGPTSVSATTPAPTPDCTYNLLQHSQLSDSRVVSEFPIPDRSFDYPFELRFGLSFPCVCLDQRQPDYDYQ